MQRLFLESLTTLWPRLGRTLVVETDQPLDLRLFPAATPPRSEGAEPAARQ
jgi:hypothetical protein